MTAFRAAFKAYRMHQVLILPRFARLTFALGLATAVFPVDAEYYFNPRFLSNDLAESVDLSAFTKGREAPPGTYRVDIYLNDEFMASRDITFIADDNNADLIPCLSTDLLVSLGIKKSALLDNKEHSADKHVPDNSACTPLQDRLADASSEFDVGQQHLSLSVPQIYVGRMARGYVSPDLWEEGINAGLLNYSFNGNSINNRSNHNAGKSNYAYLNLQSGINIGSWRLRDNSTWSYNSGSSNSSDSNKWQHINTSAERDIIPLRSRLTVGDSYTDGDIFDSVNFRGLKINSTEAMLPDSQHGFAPVIHGIARGTAQVSVKQNGYDVYQTTVPPGPFTIDDINSAANGGDLQVTIKEADGSIQTLYVPYSSVPVLQRAGYTRYALAMGEYRSGNNLQSSPKFVQASLMHGLKGNWTPYGGMQIAEDYQAFNLGIGKDLGLFGAFSFDITQANTTLADDTRHSGQSVKSVYSKSFYQTGTNIQVAGYRYSTLRRDVLNSEWKDIERISGLSQTQIAELADAYAAAERTIICYGMGITQHEHGTQNVQQLVNLLLMKGNIGKPGAGICPLRGHSNVQGDRTVGITEKPSAEFLARLGERYGFTPPHAPGHAAIASMQAICTGQARALICMGGNFALAMPDREASAVPLTQLDLAVHVATKLNRSHLLTARHSYILPVLGRSEIDMQKSGAQAVTVEDSMSMVHASRGVLKPAGVMLKSECAVVAGIAQAALPQSVVAWEYLVEDYDRIRNDIEAVLPEFADYNQRIRHPGGFHLINAAAERRWMTPSGKANFITSKGLLEDPSSAFNSKLVMATVRSHDQYNTTIYGMDDRYRGVFGQRDVVFMSAKQAKICRVKNGERVNLIALTPDGKRSSRRMDRLKVVIYPMADRSLVTYFPESNHMLTLDNHDPLSGIPGYKSIPVELEPSN